MGVKHKTKTVMRSLAPVWEETFSFHGVFGELLVMPLHFALFDWDLASKNDRLGERFVSLEPLRSGAPMERSGVKLDKARDAVMIRCGTRREAR